MMWHTGLSLNCFLPKVILIMYRQPCLVQCTVQEICGGNNKIFLPSKNYFLLKWHVDTLKSLLKQQLIQRRKRLRKIHEHYFTGNEKILSFYPSKSASSSSPKTNPSPFLRTLHIQNQSTVTTLLNLLHLIPFLDVLGFNNKLIGFSFKSWECVVLRTCRTMSYA